MATNTCVSIVTYHNDSDIYLEPFYSDRETLSEQMFDQGKTASNPNWIDPGDLPIGKRAWVDHAAAQEFLDYVIANAPVHNLTLVSTEIQDLPV
jgi:hypothetical protein